MFHVTDADSFAIMFSRARRLSPQIKAATSTFSDAPGTTYWISSDANSGYAIRNDGELVLVFSRIKGRGDAIVADAIANGANHLDCFDGYLPKLYGRHGFREAYREPNWDPEGPDVVYMWH